MDSRGRILLILFLILAVIFCSFGRFTYERIRVGIEHPYFQLDNEEGALLYQALLIREGKSIYRPLVDYPLVVGTYPPVYMLLTSCFVSPLAPSLSAGRTISAVALCFCLVAIFALVWRISGSVVAGVLAAGLFLATFEVYSWAPYHRVDFLALAFSLLGLVMWSLRSQLRLSVAGSAVLFSLAFFTKQTALAAPLALAATLLVTNRRQCLRWCLAWAGCVLVPYALLNLATGSQFFRHTVLYNANTMRWHEFSLWAAHIARFYPWFCLLIGFSLVVIAISYLRNKEDGESSSAEIGGYTSHSRDTEATEDVCEESAARHECPDCATSRETLLLVAFYFLFSLPNIVALVKAGSAENYLLEPLAAGAIVSGSVAGLLMSSLKRQSQRRTEVMAAVAIAMLASHATHVMRWSPVMFSAAKNPTSADFENAAVVTRRLAAVSGPVVSELSTYAVLAGKDVVFQPFIMSELARQKRWDQTQFINDITMCKFGLVAVTVDLCSDAFTDAFTPEMRKALCDNYECRDKLLGGSLWRHYLYYPRQRQGKASQRGQSQ
jgi:hypothetical protein